MTRYTVKRRLTRPITSWRRRRAGDLGPITRAMYEAHDYRPALGRFFGATRANPDILVDVALRDGSVIVDVGAYRGEWSIRMLERADALGARDVRLHAFEPEKLSLEHLRRAVDDDPRVHLHQFGLGASDRTERMAIAGLASSVHKEDSEEGFVGSIDIELRDVGTALDSLGIECVDVLMVNIEGGEFELLDRLYECQWLPRIDVIFVQFHEFGPDAYRSRRRNRRQLAATHQCVWNYTWVFERWDRASTANFR